VRILTYLDQHQMRLGYLNCAALVATRQLDSHGSLVRRLEELLFNPAGGSHPIIGQYKRVVTSRKSPEMPHQIWLNDPEVGDSGYQLAPDRCYKIIQWARNVDVIGQTYALSELGVLLKGLLIDAGAQHPDIGKRLNPFALWRRRTIALAHLYLLLRADILLPFLLATQPSAQALAASGSQSQRPSTEISGLRPQSLLEAIDNLVAAIGDDLPIDQALLLKEIRNMQTRFKSPKALNHHYRPRRQYLLDLKLLEKSSPSKAGTEQLYLPTVAGARVAEACQELLQHPLEQDRLLEEKFFGWVARIYDVPVRPPGGDITRLEYFARGFPLVGRDIGFTPGRTVAVAGCLLALEDGVLIEVEHMFRMMREMAKSPFRPFLHYSGGSRLDCEFLIKIDVNPLLEAIRDPSTKVVTSEPEN